MEKHLRNQPLDTKPSQISEARKYIYYLLYIKHNDETKKRRSNERPLTQKKVTKEKIETYTSRVDENAGLNGIEIENDNHPSEKFMEDRPAYNEHKRLFYMEYKTLWDKSGRTGVAINDYTYKQILDCLRASKDDPKRTLTRIEKYWIKNYNNTYSCDSEILFRKTKTKTGRTEEEEKCFVQVSTYEKIYDILLKVHISLSHGKTRSMKNSLDKRWYKIPREVVQLFCKTCPACMHQERIQQVTQRPLKMIYSTFTGHRAQIDLIDMRAYEKDGYKWILHYVDCHSGFRIVKPMKDKTSKTVSHCLAEIFSHCVIPKILLLRKSFTIAHWGPGEQKTKNKAQKGFAYVEMQYWMFRIRDSQQKSSQHTHFISLRSTFLHSSFSSFSILLPSFIYCFASRCLEPKRLQ
jgi:hypothetical protein